MHRVIYVHKPVDSVNSSEGYVIQFETNNGFGWRYDVRHSWDAILKLLAAYPDYKVFVSGRV